MAFNKTGELKYNAKWSPKLSPAGRLEFYESVPLRSRLARRQQQQQRQIGPSDARVRVERGAAPPRRFRHS